MSHRESMDRHDQNQDSYREESPTNNPRNGDHRRERSRSRSKREYNRSSRERNMEDYGEGRASGSRGDRRASRSPNSNRRRHIAPRDNPPSGRCLGVFGLSIYTTEKHLKELLDRFGPIEDIQVVYDAQTGRSRGFAFVYFEREEDAAAAKDKCNGTEMDGRKIRVDFSVTQRAHTPTPGVYMGKSTHNRTGRDGGPRRDGRGDGRYDSRHDSGAYRRPREDSRAAPYDYPRREDYRGPPRDPYADSYASRAPPPAPHYDDRYRDSYRRRSPSPYYGRPSSSRGGYRERSRSYSPRRYSYY